MRARAPRRKLVETRLIVAYSLIALLLLAVIVAARVFWYRSWPQRTAREHKRQLRFNEQRQHNAASRSGH